MTKRTTKTETPSPAVQLVTLHGSKVTTSSLLVAEMFEKRHDDVLRAIRHLLPDLPGEDLRNFAEIFVNDSYGRKQPAYEMSRDGFSLLAMGFTGRKALEWKLKFLKAFNFMERALLNRQNLSWQEVRANNKIGRREESDVIARFVEYATNQGSKHAGKYYINLTNMTYRALFPADSTSTRPIRDLLDSAQITFLTTAELMVQSAIEEGMKKEMFYKDIYQLARDRVSGFALQLPPHRLAVHLGVIGDEQHQGKQINPS